MKNYFGPSRNLRATPVTI